MEIIPAIDLMNGGVVRLIRGDPKAPKTYKHLGDPVAVARRWESEGAGLIHVIDLDAALGRGSNLLLIEKIVRSVDVPVQVGGGIRSSREAQRMLRMGVYRIILGALAFDKIQAVTKLVREFGDERVAVALDHRDGMIMTHGWRVSTSFTVDAAMTRFKRIGVRTFLVTSIARDGTLTGPDYEVLTKVCSHHPDVRVIAAGGVGGLEDLVFLKQMGVYGVVIGRALYEGAFRFEDAVKIVREGRIR